jgi:hypothetical protein
MLGPSPECEAQRCSALRCRREACCRRQMRAQQSCQRRMWVRPSRRTLRDEAGSLPLQTSPAVLQRRSCQRPSRRDSPCSGQRQRAHCCRQRRTARHLQMLRERQRQRQTERRRRTQKVQPRSRTLRWRRRLRERQRLSTGCRAGAAGRQCGLLMAGGRGHAPRSCTSHRSGTGHAGRTGTPPWALEPAAGRWRLC